MATTANISTTLDVPADPKNGVDVEMATSASPPPTATTAKSPMDTSKPSSITPAPTSSSTNAKLASMLADALSQVESLKTALHAEQKRASYYESLASSLQAVQTSPTSSSPSAPSETVQQKVAELENRAYEAELRVEREVSRRHALVEQWTALSRYFDRLDAVAKDARMRMDRVVESGSPSEAHLMLHIPTVEEQAAYLLSGSSKSRRRRRSSSMERDVAGGDVYGPPAKRSRSDRHGAYHQYPPSLDPEHPNHLYAQSPHPQQSQSFPPPPHHVSRTNSGGRHHHHHVHHHHTPTGSQDANMTNGVVVSQLPSRQSNHTQSSSRRPPRSHNRERSRSRSASPTHSRSQSDGSTQSLDEMLLQASTADSPHALNGPGYPPQPGHAKAGTIPGRERSHSHMGPPPPQGYPPVQYSQFSHPPPPAPPGYAHPNSSTTGSSLSPRSRYLSDSPPVSRRERDPREYDYDYEYRNGRDGRERTQSITVPAHTHVSHQLTPQVTLREVEGRQPVPQAKPTHTFVPIQTGAPTKKARWSATGPDSATSPGSQGVSHAGSLPSLGSTSSSSLHANPSLPASFTSSAAPTSPFPATNASGQRICRQCGALGRYKEGKCVEKWGPGPMGPGTVCDRCRKKMKRVERRKALQAEAEMGEEESQSPNPLAHAIGRTDTLIYTPDSVNGNGNGASRSTGKLVLPALSTLSTSNSRSGSRAGSIVNGSGSRKASPSTAAPGSKTSSHLTPARMVQPPQGSSLAARKPITSNGRHQANSNGSSGSNRSSGSMDMDADGEADDDFDAAHVTAEADGDADLTDLVERQVEEELELRSKADEEEEDQVDGELAEMVGEPEREREKYVDRRMTGHHATSKPSSRPTGYIKGDNEDIDVAVSQLAGVDDQDGDAEMEGDADSDLLEAVHASEAKG